MTNLTKVNNLKCDKCSYELSTCANCEYTFELSAEYLRCLEFGEQFFHFCNDDCIINFMFKNYVFDAYAV